ncbi:hypothetical protein D915_000762 [Fasciola hepatica]|uniref:Uncharacterized protein n=1 Tax=Fasciola hepatica TaxID=6192 RepID=A0A4E0RI45_FASHE|nr:hypothetical protein D915_000762 [Fasciola hepatica]
MFFNIFERLCSLSELASIYCQELGCNLDDGFLQSFMRTSCSVICNIMNFEKPSPHKESSKRRVRSRRKSVTSSRVSEAFLPTKVLEKSKALICKTGSELSKIHPTFTEPSHSSGPISNTQIKLPTSTSSNSPCQTTMYSPDIDSKRGPESLLTKLLITRCPNLLSQSTITTSSSAERSLSQATVPSSIACRPLETSVGIGTVGPFVDGHGLLDRLWRSAGPTVDIMDVSTAPKHSRSFVLNTAPVIRTVDSSSYVTVRRQLSEAVVSICRAPSRLTEET